VSAKTLLCASLFALAGTIMAAPLTPDAAREEAIRKARFAILTELKAEGGDWAAWYKRLEPTWQELGGKIAEAAQQKRTSPANEDSKPAEYVRQGGLLHTEGTPPLFVQAPSARYLMADGQDPDAYIHSRPSVSTVVAFSNWLKRHGVDLLLVPAPKMVQVYPDRVLKDGPRDGVIAPHMKKLLLELLDANVEVLDLLPAFLAASKQNPEPLFLATDSHWSQRAQKIAAALIAERLQRYPFVERAKSQVARFKTRTQAVTFRGDMGNFLSPEERKEVEPWWHLNLTQVLAPDGTPLHDVEDSPVVLIGDSYVHQFSTVLAAGTGIESLLAREINLNVSDRSAQNDVGGILKDFIRDPELLRVHKVVVWVVTSDSFTESGTSKWTTPDFPGGETEKEAERQRLAIRNQTIGVANAVSVTPNSGGGSIQVFSATYSDTLGALHLMWPQLVFNSGFSGTPGCWVQYEVISKTLKLAGDDNRTTQSAVLGTPGPLQNSQCTVDVGNSSAVIAGNTLVLKVAISFKAGFRGGQFIYMLAQDSSSQDTSPRWRNMGTWTVP
jgi:hypothetical protein